MASYYHQLIPQETMFIISNSGCTSIFEIPFLINQIVLADFLSPVIVLSLNTPDQELTLEVEEASALPCSYYLYY